MTIRTKRLGPHNSTFTTPRLVVGMSREKIHTIYKVRGFSFDSNTPDTEMGINDSSEVLIINRNGRVSIPWHRVSKTSPSSFGLLIIKISS